MAAKKSARSKRGSAKKRPVRKGTAKRSSKTRSTRPKKKAGLRSRAQKGFRVARQGMDTVRQAGERTWEVLKSTTSQVVEDVKGKLGQNPERDTSYR